ncbi:hypothetical protein [Neobacillus sp. FSL H8-0543]|uniref:hypothetical protein n=1 Tax=Neobacillus sp. FSL H8-0543 TaxID=2954672 RepID=UPI0031591FFE
MDKVTCFAFFLYQTSKSQDIKDIAVQLLNGDVSIRDLKRNVNFQADLLLAESSFRKNKINKNQVQKFAEEFMLLEV